VENPDPKLKTARQRLTAHSQNPACAGCHRITDPIGLALENFDGAGRYRPNEKGADIDVSGIVDGKKFSDIEGMGEALQSSPALPACLVRRAYSYATAGSVPASSEPVVGELNKKFATDGYRLSPLLRAIALHDSFSMVVPPKPVADEKDRSVASAH
jgi:hypothetical protein